MLRRDLIKDQIEQLGKMLGIIIGEFLGLKLLDRTQEGIEIANQQLQSQHDIDVNQLAELSGKDLEHYLTERNLHPDHLNILSVYLKELGIAESETSSENAKKWFQKALDLLEIADETSKEYSFERMKTKESIEQCIQQL